MFKITFPDGAEKSYEYPMSGTQIVNEISKSLAKRTVAMNLNGMMVDLATVIHTDSAVRFIERANPLALSLIRHSATHVLAEAVTELFPGAKTAIGPATKDGFFYDFDNVVISENDLPRIEARMHEIIKRNELFKRTPMDRDLLEKYFAKAEETYKGELLAGIPEDVDVTIYHQGQWFDMCRGPHVVSTGQIGDAFKLVRVSGAYWRGDSTQPMLTRISGILFGTKEELHQYEIQQEQAELRDHRRTGPQLDYFHFDEKAPGSVFWHPRGWQVFQNLIQYMRETQNAAGYQEINTPDMMDKSLWEISGHWQNYHANMFTTKTEDGREFAFKPMNCPGHMMVYNQGIKSYRDLPIRYSEFGKVHRYEPSGALHGLMRVRSFTQDDAHIFCTPEQLLDECVAVNNLIFKIYKDFGFKDVRVKLSTRPDNSIGTDAAWEQSEQALKDALDHLGQPYTIFEGEGAFYGPKLEYVLTDAIGRDWQCGTLQVDFNLPGEDRFDSTYVDRNNTRKHPVMLHRAMFGSLERFFGILLEHFAGELPFWLQPTQVVVIPIGPKHVEYCEKLVQTMSQWNKIRVGIDPRDDNMNNRIADAFKAKVPAVLVVGDQEMKQRAGYEIYTLRFRDGKEYRDDIGEIMSDLAETARSKK